MSRDIWDSCFQQKISYDALNFPRQPTQSDLEKRLGKELTEVFFQTCKPIDKIFFGRDKPLKGPGDKKLWINPSDRLNGERVQMTEQPSQIDCLQALTHRGILEIGGRVEKMVAERNKSIIEAKVKEAEDIARFEADLRIKFHVEQARAKLNEEWQQHFDELVKDHEEEKKNLIKVIQESREIFCEFVAKKCQDEINKHVEEAVAKTTQEMEGECSKRIDDELAQQHAILQESMEVTLKNLEANDRERMNELCNQCLNAMDVQNNLMMCRQITELMHLMSIEKNHWKQRMSDLKEKYEMTIKALESKINLFIAESSPEHQSNSFIVALWKKFFKSLKSIDVNELNECERRILTEIQRIQSDLIENYDDNLSIIFKVDDDNGVENKQDLSNENLIDDWMDQTDSECLNTESSVAVAWKRQTPSEVISIDDKFISSIFYKMSKADALTNIHDSIFPKTASSIITMVKGSEDDDRLLEGKVMEILHKLQNQQQALTKSDIIPLPNVDSSHIRDSREIIDKKISMVEESVEGRQNILGVVDSLELLNNRASVDSKDLAFNSTDSEEEQSSTYKVVNLSPKETLSSNPPYMEVPRRTDLVYKRMTEEEWNELKAMQPLILHSKRHSSVQFTNSPPRQTAENGAIRTSILKNPSTSSARHDLHPDHNVLRPIEEKCQELVNNMKFKSILKLLCADNIVNAKTSSIMSFDSQKK